MRPQLFYRTASAHLVVAAALLSSPGGLVSQEFDVPLGLTHFVYRPAEDAEALEDLRAWTFGFGVTLGSKSKPGYGVAAHATYGGPYWYIAGSAVIWQSASSPNATNFGYGIHAQYNVFQSRDFRTRVGWQAGWSTAGSGDTRVHLLDYRALVSHSLGTSLSVFAGIGAETSRGPNTGSPRRGTHPSVLAGVNARLGPRYSFATGIESVFSTPVKLQLAGSVQLEGHNND